MNIFLSSDFDPLQILNDSSIQPPITNVKPYKTFSALKLNQLLARPTNQKSNQTNSSTRSTSDNNKSEPQPSGSNDFGQDKTSNSEIEFTLKTTNNTSMNESIATSQPVSNSIMERKPRLDELPPLQPNETYEYFLERKYSQKDHPYQLLYDCFVNKSRVMVRVRMGRHHDQHYSTLFGTLSGFDKFFNLILLNVDEEYYQVETIYKKQKTLDKEKGITNRKPRNRKRAVRTYIPKQRSFPLLFVKGCHVILISRANAIVNDERFTLH
ncbi:hypothetical protein C9374_009081 [Naegleria lovaniensis]|uniref:Sm domain-containing protein n=1 Tax=Naegleria lovaniensis TaxID=51637 RepID=A0AA88GI85_NAELO|nr:uncharacterized protein C9374_009081 [Naegleria lovaniensis]KAG2377565.1 hypothetical protein C9374_009081 [Naegleria lovaniensis]